MNKVIAAFDTYDVSDSTMRYAAYLSKQFNSHIVAAFLGDIGYHGKPGNVFGKLYNHEDWTGMDVATRKDELVAQVAIRKVSGQFNAEGVEYNIHQDQQIALQSLLKESHFADMIVIDVNDNFSTTDTSKPSRFLKGLLENADCPVLIVPHTFTPIEKVILTYDGEPSSVYAIRHFSYLFSSLTTTEVELLMITNEAHTTHLPDYELLKELLKRKYTTVQNTVIRSKDTNAALVNHLQSQQQQYMVILGAYHRNALSRWLHHSTADSVIANVDMPVFVAHR